jgi:hypothetical protein
MQSASKPKVWQPLLIFVVFIVGGWWLLNTFTTRNPNWFRRTQPVYTPERLDIYADGTVTEVGPGDIGFDRLVEALNATLSRFTNYDKVDVGLSDETLGDYEERGVVVVAHYGEDLQFNLPVRFVNVNTLLIPIVGRHSNARYVFLGTDSAYQAGALQVENREPLDRALQELGYLNGDEAGS